MGAASDKALAVLEGHTAELTGDVRRGPHPSGHAARDGTAKIERVIQVTQDLIDGT
jgi:hypothetical protein